MINFLYVQFFFSLMFSLACECAKKTREKGWGYFGLQYYGECWSGPSVQYDRDGSSNQCVGNDFKSCDETSESECVGKRFTNYIYQLIPSKIYNVFFFYITNVTNG